MTPAKDRFDFFKVHLNQDKKDFTQYGKKVNFSLDSREKSAAIVGKVVNDKARFMLDEMIRDVRVFRSRFAKVSEKLDELVLLVRKADLAFSSKRLDFAQLADEAVAAFFAWRETKYDLSANFVLTVNKWEKFEREISTHFTS